MKSTFGSISESKRYSNFTRANKHEDRSIISTELDPSEVNKILDRPTLDFSQYCSATVRTSNNFNNKATKPKGSRLKSAAVLRENLRKLHRTAINKAISNYKLASTKATLFSNEESIPVS